MPKIGSKEQAEAVLSGNGDPTPPGTKLVPQHETGKGYQARSTPDDKKQKLGSAASQYHRHGARGRAHSFLAAKAYASGDTEEAMKHSEYAAAAFKSESNGRGAEKGKVGGTDDDTHTPPLESARADQAYHDAKYHEFKDIWEKQKAEKEAKRQALVAAMKPVFDEEKKKRKELTLEKDAASSKILQGIQALNAGFPPQ